MAYERELTVAREAARLAGRLCLEVRRQMLGDDPDEARLEKAGREPVTIADYGAQAIVLREIARHFPDDATIAEERASEFDRLATPEQQEQTLNHLEAMLGDRPTLDEVRSWLDSGRGGTSKRVWTVDPIDGTKGFLRGDQFAVAVALLVDGELQVGALCCPLLTYDEESQGVVASAARGQGGRIETMDGSQSRALHVSDKQAAETARTVESVETGHTDHSFSQRALRLAGIGGAPVRMDSQAKYVAVADGRAELYIRDSRGDDYREKIWDHAAGALIVEEAGGRVSDLLGAPLDFSLGAKLEKNQGALASHGPLHDLMLDSIQQADAEKQSG